jgi:hypothetical protein
MNTIEEVWYLSSKNTFKSKRALAMDDIGTLSVYPDGLHFKGTEHEAIIKRIQAINYGRQGRHFINKWAKVSYYNADHELVEVYFADGGKKGWSGIFGGTKKIYQLLKDIYKL